MQQKTNIPDGYEIDKEKSTLELIIFKKIIKKRALSVKDIPNRNWYIDTMGRVRESLDYNYLNNVSNEKRAYAQLAFVQLVELRDNWNEGWVADWCNINQEKFCIYIYENKPIIEIFYAMQITLSFKDEQTASEFFEQFKELIETAKELL